MISKIQNLDGCFVIHKGKMVYMRDQIVHTPTTVGATSISSISVSEPVTLRG